MNTVKEATYRPSLALQVLMFCNVYLSIAWNIVYGLYILINLSKLSDLHGVCVIIAYIIGSLVEFYRLRMGYKGNTQARVGITDVFTTCKSPGDLCTFLILSPLVQLPILVFLLLSAKEFIGMLMYIAITTLVVMALEFIACMIALFPKTEKNIIVSN